MRRVCARSRGGNDRALLVRAGCEAGATPPELTGLARREGSRPCALCYADAGAGTGLGHVARVVALGEALVARGLQVTVITPPDEPARRIASAAGLAWRAEPSDLGPESIGHPGPDVLVVDTYRLGQDRLARLRGSAKLLVSVADSPQPDISADVVIDGAPGSERRAYRGPHLRTVLAGSRYALVPSAFVQQRRLDRDDLDRIVVSLGADPPPAALELIVDTLVGRGAPIDLVRGPYATMGRRDGVLIHDPPDHVSVARLFAAAAVGVVGAGQTLLQAAAAGLPCVAVIMAANQEGQAKAAYEAGMLLALLRPAPDDLGERLWSVLGDADRRREVAVRALDAVDGEGPHRVGSVLVGLLAER